MALARLTTLLSILLYIQEIHGQQISPSAGQNNSNQALQSNQLTTQENCIQNQNGNPANKATNLNAQAPLNFQSINPLSSISAQSSLCLQQPQRSAQPVTLQLSQISNLQPSFSVQPSLQFQTSLPQKSPDLQQSQNLQQTQNVYRIPLVQQIPATKQPNQQTAVNAGNYNIQKSLSIGTPIVTQFPGQPSQSIPNVSFISSTPSASAIPSYPCQRTDNLLNILGANYVPITTSGYSTIDAPQISTPYSSLPVMAFLSTPTSKPVVSHTVFPCGNEVPNIESPLRNSNNFFISEIKDLNKDTLTSALLTLLSSKISSKSIAPSVLPENPYLSSYLNKGSKSSSIKSLLPLILDILSERNGCGCRVGCQNCDQNKRNIEESRPRIYDGYSKQRDYSLKEEFFKEDRCEECIPRKVREHKKTKKLKNSIPVNSSEDGGTEYEDCYEEDED